MIDAVRIRTATRDDADGVRAIYAPFVASTAVSFERDVPSVAEMADRIAQRQPLHPWLVAADADGGIAGFAYAGRFSGRAAYDWSVETSIYLAEAARGRSVGRRLYGALLALLRVQGYRQALALIALPNTASVGLHETLGFTAAGVARAVGWKLGAWHDVGWWQLALDPPDAGRVGEPSPPVPLDALPDEVVAAALSPE